MGSSSPIVSSLISRFFSFPEDNDDDDDEEEEDDNNEEEVENDENGNEGSDNILTNQHEESILSKSPKLCEGEVEKMSPLIQTQNVIQEIVQTAPLVQNETIKNSTNQNNQNNQTFDIIVVHEQDKQSLSEKVDQINQTCDVIDKSNGKENEEEEEDDDDEEEILWCQQKESTKPLHQNTDMANKNENENKNEQTLVEISPSSQQREGDKPRNKSGDLVVDINADSFLSDNRRIGHVKKTFKSTSRGTIPTTAPTPTTTTTVTTTTTTTTAATTTITTNRTTNIVS